MTGLRLAFMGTPHFALPTFRALTQSSHEVVCVYTQPPRPAGRGKAPKPSPVEEFAQTQAIPVRTPKNFKDAKDKEAFKALNLDVAIVAAYGLILPNAILEAPRFGCLNVHGSLLPRWRGAAPIQRAIMAGDTATGVTIMQMDEGLDTGDMLLLEEIEISPTMTSGELHDQMAEIGARLVLRTLDQIENGLLAPTPQPSEGVTYADKIRKDEARIDWSQPAEKVDWHIRGLSPFPGAWFEIRGGEKTVRVKALRSQRGEGSGPPGTLLEGGFRIACGTGAVELLEVQREGKRVMAAEDFLKGIQLKPGDRLA